jgi:replicative DNA helicase
LSKKKNLHQEAIFKYFENRPMKTARDVVPYVVWSLFIIPAMEAAGMTPKTAGVALGYNSLANLYKQNLSRERLMRVAEVFQSASLVKLGNSGVYWDKIISIDTEGEEEVYDLTVDGLHNFVVNEYISHNSIEQDSDIVMFIYRDDVYNPESEQKNIANLILAKHRNGPVGEVSLYFQPSQTRFRDLEATPTEE